MARIKPKLYLNTSPSTVEDNALVFARNMKLDDDGCLVSDYGYNNIPALSSYTIVGHIVGLDNKVYFFTADDILEYDEILETVTVLNTAWTYHGGEITGCVTTNVSGEKILTIAESGTQTLIPLKHINLYKDYANVNDESLYSQAPSVPTANLHIVDTYVKTIPNGTYIFFIRYKIRKDTYTNWYLCSRPIFAGTSEKVNTLQGGLKYVNLHKDSAKSFVLQLDFATVINKAAYSECQLGFIISHDEATDARIWKSFELQSFVENPTSSQNLIYFDYENVQEVNINDLIENTYELYNVKNVTSFKNRLYIGNYTESNFNPTTQNDVNNVEDLANSISLDVIHNNIGDINYKNAKYWTGNDWKSLIYNYANGYYIKSEDDVIIKDLLNIDMFQYNAFKLSKGDSKEKSSVMTFDIYYSNGNDPDIAIVYNIKNNLYESAIFGQTLDELTPSFSSASSDNLKKYGIKDNTQPSTITTVWIFKPVDTDGDIDPDYNNHPWYELGLTFAYGSAKPSDPMAENTEGCLLFNKDSYAYYTDASSDHNIGGWPSRDIGLHDDARQTIKDTIKKEIEGKSFFAKAYVEIYSGAKIYTIGYASRMEKDNYAGYYDDLDIIPVDYISSDMVGSDFYDKIRHWVYDNILYEYIVGLNEFGVPVLNIDGDYIQVSNIAIKYKKFEFTTDIENVINEGGEYKLHCTVDMKTTDYTGLVLLNVNENYIKIDDIQTNISQNSTLMPLSKYQPYVHFVDAHNIVTNGVKLNEITTGPAISDTDLLHLTYQINDLPQNIKYKSFFISLVNIGDIVIEGFNYSRIKGTNRHVIHSIELDTLLYNLNDNIKIKIYKKVYDSQTQTYNMVLQDTITDASYYSSGTSNPVLAFGNCGYVEFTSVNDFSDCKFYIIIDRVKDVENTTSLTKCSEYIPLVETDSAKTLSYPNYGSYLCLVKKPNFELSSNCYVSGNDIYTIDRTSGIVLTDFKGSVNNQSSMTYVIRSNFNLNYLTLTEDLNDKIFTVGGLSSGVKQIAKAINSATLSYIYELKAMYKDFFNKTFRPLDTEYKIDFDNTIRVSSALSDEVHNASIFKFLAEDYYNIPTDRGKIVKVFSIANNIFVHTKASLYKFDANQTISASNTDIVLQESEPFNTGVVQVFDSQHGYGGLYNKEAGCITFDSYIFYDNTSNHIFAYGGNGQVQIIDATIYKLLKYYNPAECYTLHDEDNNRVLFYFIVSDNFKFTLSYNYKAKSFISFHDINLINSFNTRAKAYSYKGELCSLFKSNILDNTEIDATLHICNLFGAASDICTIQFGVNIEDYKIQNTPFGIAVVIHPMTNPRIVIDNIKYIANIINNFASKYDTHGDTISLPMHVVENPVKSIYIITDTCLSNIINTNVNDETRPTIDSKDNSIPNSLLDYKGIKHDVDSWNLNFFRNILNSNNIYNYPAYPSGQPRQDQPINMDNNSLIYGRYGVINFNFITTKPIKIEDVSINETIY